MDYFLDLAANFELRDLSLREVLMKRAAKVSAFLFSLGLFDYPPVDRKREGPTDSLYLDLSDPGKWIGCPTNQTRPQVNAERFNGFYYSRGSDRAE